MSRIFSFVGWLGGCFLAVCATSFLFWLGGLLAIALVSVACFEVFGDQALVSLFLGVAEMSFSPWATGLGLLLWAIFQEFLQLGLV